MKMAQQRVLLSQRSTQNRIAENICTFNINPSFYFLNDPFLPDSLLRPSPSFVLVQLPKQIGEHFLHDNVMLAIVLLLLDELSLLLEKIVDLCAELLQLGRI